jgi:hypothetical protein
MNIKHSESLSPWIVAAETWLQNPEESDTDFARLVSSWLTITGQPKRVLAKEFEASISTITRWRKGKVEPHEKMQQLVVKRLVEAAKGIKQENE